MGAKDFFAVSLIRFVRSGVRRGYYSSAIPPSELTWFDLDAALARPDDIFQSDGVIVIPTYLERCGVGSHRAAIRKILEQVQGPLASEHITNCRFIVAFQYGRSDLGRAIQHVEQILADFPQDLKARVAFGLINLHGKVNALNKCIAILGENRFEGYIGWVDDDVALGEDCIAKLKLHLESNKQTIVAGAEKIPISNVQRAAHWFHRMKLTARATSRPIPHGCALLGRFSALSGGVPTRYVGEDGFISISLFDEKRTNALEQLAVVQGATCQHTVGGPAVQIFKRVQRTIDLNTILLADFDEEKSVRFAKEVIFHGLLSPPLPHQDQKVAMANKLLKSSLFLMYLVSGTKFHIRGLVGYPMSAVKWNGYDKFSHPSQ